MFLKYLQQLQRGQSIDTRQLSGMFEVALVKKVGVLRMPYLCRSQDTKINPPMEQMLAVAAILKDEEKISVCLDLLLTEAGQKSSGGSSAADTKDVPLRIDNVFALLTPFPEERSLFETVLKARGIPERNPGKC